MAVAISRSWADVYVDDATHRPALESRALFFIPAAPVRCDLAGLSAADLSVAYAMQRTQVGHPILAGRSIHTKVLSGKPVNYESAIGFLNVSREPLSRNGQRPLETTDIVACVFRLKDPDQLAVALRTDVLAISRACNLRIRIVESALARFRLPLMDALAIWRFFRDLQAEGRGEGVSLVGERLTDDPREFIKTDKRRPFVVKPIEEDDFVYSLADLRAAPRAGHPWALFLPAPDPPTATEAPDPNPPRPPTSGGRGA